MKKKIIYFDGICLLCNGLINFILKHDKKGEFNFSPLQSDYAKKNIINQSLDTVYLQEENVFFQKSDAVLKIFFGLGGFWKVSFVFYLVPKVIRDFAYDLVANSRYKIWGKQLQCRLPSASEKDRFIL